MAKEICISSTPHETRLAILEDDQLAEIYYERENEYTLAGSIYNGRVTRVLPGMQSAFVDLGLERDAFLYVTDFIELEDQEETDELERAAATGQAPREVKHPQGIPQGTPQSAPPSIDRNGGRRDERGGRGGDRRPESKPERHALEETPIELSAAGSASAAAPADTAREREEEGGGRWRGRRRRRGGRGQGAPAEAAGKTEPRIAETTEPSERVQWKESQLAREVRPAQPAPPAHQASATIVLPGESLSKYGGAPAGETTPEKPAPPRRNYTSKPSTLIDAPITWDGSGLLPGESIARRRGPQPEVEPEIEHDLPSESEPAAEASATTEQTVEDPDETEEIQETEEIRETKPPQYAADAETEEAEEPAFEFEEESLDADEDEDVFGEDAPRLGTGAGAIAAEEEFEETTDSAPVKLDEEESDASASHRVDPSSPTGFRLFGFGKKKKEEEEAVTTKIAAPVSTYAPGQGLVEEEVIEGEEFDGAPHARRHKPEVHDLDVYEEETLPANIRPGELGEMFQEAHLDHRIQRNLDEPAGDEEEDEAAGEEGAATGAPPVRRGQQRDRGQRGRGPQRGRGGPSRRSAQTSDLPIISDLLKSGQEILVQIAKEPIAKKGARITSHIALPGRFLVFMPTVSHVGVSRKIASDEERHRLKRILLHERGEASGGFIVRTAAEGASEEELRADLRFLMNLWNDIKQRSESSKSPALIYHDLSLIERILRDQVSANFSNIWVDTEADYERIVRFLNRFSPSLVRRVKLYNKEVPLFEHFGIEDEISKALRSKVWLKSGGSIVINQTEALVAIDINTGKYVGKSARLEDTILKTNLDAVPEIVRQIRLRDLGGIIVIDFIDMDERKNRFRVMAALEEALKNDRAPTKVLQFNDFGLVAITRKRVKQSLERTLSVPCPTCQATGMVKSSATVCNEIYIEMRKMRKHFEAADVMLRVHPETVKVLKGNNARWLTEFEELIGKNLLLKSDPTLHPEQFDIQG
jgi:Rne/Rng family ribonuclease